MKMAVRPNPRSMYMVLCHALTKLYTQFVFSSFKSAIQVLPNEATILQAPLRQPSSVLANPIKKMSAYENVVGGKLKLKGKALDVKSSGVKKKKKQKKLYEDVTERKEEKVEGGDAESSLADGEEEDPNESDKLGGERKAGNFGDHLTPAEKRYIEQREKLDAQKYEKTSKKSHRDRLDDFNQYLADLSEHYDIPKVGPG